jgi:GNAT superfamily N-acetyltransferase
MTDKLSGVVRLMASHNTGGFRCGRPALDQWLHRHARAADAMDSARTFVVHRAGDVVGYFSLTMGSVERAEPPGALIRGMPAYPVAAVLLARLAVDEREHRGGLGAGLLADALQRGTLAGEQVAARLFMVDALDEDAAGFYERFGFLPAPNRPLRLYRRIKDIRASMQA